MFAFRACFTAFCLTVIAVHFFSCFRTSVGDPVDHVVGKGGEIEGSRGERKRDSWGSETEE